MERQFTRIGLPAAVAIVVPREPDHLGHTRLGVSRRVGSEGLINNRMLLGFDVVSIDAMI